MRQQAFTLAIAVSAVLTGVSIAAILLAAAQNSGGYAMAFLGLGMLATFAFATVLILADSWDRR